MRQYSGSISLLGNSVINRDGVKYSVIEFENGTLIQDVFVPKVSDNFLQKAFSQQLKPTIHLGYKNILIGIEVGDGKKHCVSLPIFAPIISFFAVLAFLPFPGIGLALLPAAIKVANVYSAGKTLASEGFNKLPWRRA